MRVYWEAAGGGVGAGEFTGPKEGGQGSCQGKRERWERGKKKKEEGKGLLGVEVVPSLPGQLSAFAMQITCAEHQKVSGERRQEEQEGQEKFC